VRHVSDYYDTTYSYTYDNNGNILTVSDGTNTTSYVYDSANQLIRENNPYAQKTWTWTYDNAGNILTRYEYAYTTGALGTATDTVVYTYGDSNWGDLLTKYDGTDISYDAIGNTLTDGTWTYEWKRGRQLVSMTEADDNVTWSFGYDANGMRTSRTNGSTTYTYTYNGDRLTGLTIGNNTLYFNYGANGTPMSVIYNGTYYYYITNIQGDIVAITNSSGSIVVRYTYDAWGNILSTTGSMATTLGMHNPLRYRGYVYDQETSLYYLQSRYYNPELGRFINADKYTSTGQNILGSNMFVYCNNNPVMYTDPTGEFAISTLVLVIAGIAVLTTASAITYGAITDTPVVLDISLSVGVGADVGVKVGLSVVLDFKNESFGFYPHYGCYYGMKFNAIGVSYSVGLISNYENEGDYAGPFTSMGGGYLVGIDHCYDPRYDHDGTVKANSLTFGNNKGVYYGYDYYGYWGSVPFLWRGLINVFENNIRC